VNRREALLNLGAAAVAAVSPDNFAMQSTNNFLNPESIAMTSPHTLEPDGHFLSATNPLATVDQRNLEALAIEITQTPAVAKARKIVESYWRAAAGRRMMSAQAWAVFDDMITEYIFNNALAAANADPNYPKLVAFVFGPPHEWFGRKVPGARCVGGSSDNVYRQAPIDPSVHYELAGQCFSPDPRDMVFTAQDKFHIPVQAPILDKNALKINEDGTFTVTIGPDPANGRSNYLQMLPVFKFLLVRDVMSDWRQIPNALRIRRIEPPSAQPWTTDRMAEKLAYSIVNDVSDAFYWTAFNKGLIANEMTPPINSGTLGGIEGQRGCFGRITLSDDEAFVVTVSHSGATFRALNLYDEWYRNLDPRFSISSFANNQAVGNSDGTITYVISGKDPGVYNWLNTAGFNEVYMMHRWQGLPPSPKISVNSQVVKLSDLSKVLPKDTKWITKEEREHQVAERLDQYLKRYVDH
jgi:hypothetical protein